MLASRPEHGNMAGAATPEYKLACLPSAIHYLLALISLYPLLLTVRGCVGAGHSAFAATQEVEDASQGHVHGHAAILGNQHATYRVLRTYKYGTFSATRP